MKQKYLVMPGDNPSEIVVREMAELEKKEYTFVCEKSYAQPDLKNAAQAGPAALIEALRTADFFPPLHVAEKIAEAMAALAQGETTDTAEILIDDLESSREAEAAALREAEEVHESALDALLEDDFENDVDDDED